ncbi:MAG: DUF1801 domain-containing protein [Gemmatimonadaceae bacterium]|nr:DUF1801 domain-containing protein [Gemmatimonadaceae bacterium]
MAETKTRPTNASVSDYIASRANDAQRADCKTLIAMMRKATGKPPRMWGPSIVGFGSYHYEYASGHSGDSCLTGFAIRGREVVLYLAAEGARPQALLKQLGKHRMGKSCLYLKSLADVDLEVLRELIDGSIAEVRRRYPG